MYHARIILMFHLSKLCQVRLRTVGREFALDEGQPYAEIVRLDAFEISHVICGQLRAVERFLTVDSTGEPARR